VMNYINTIGRTASPRRFASDAIGDIPRTEPGYFMVKAVLIYSAAGGIDDAEVR
jgi:hypothetical protein